MPLGEDIAQHQALADSLADILSARIAAATPIETLSDRSNKLLRVVQEPDGQRFVTRSFSPVAVHEAENYSGIDFRSAWDSMHKTLTKIGITVVRGSLLETGEDDYPFVAVNEYHRDVQPFREAPTAVKAEVASALGGMLLLDSDFFPSPSLLQADMFGLVTDETGKASAVMLDTDPLVIPQRRIKTDSGVSQYLQQLTELFWDKWCEPEDREAVFKKLTQSAVGLVEEWPAATGAFTVLHFMGNGLDTRNLGLS